ncbi:MAG TPA: cytochrome c peroxidase [Blastocatellia bacterium]|nr:cytochrome c peroxidase [Blastocatellia bacterium]
MSLNNSSTESVLAKQPRAKVLKLMATVLVIVGLALAGYWTLRNGASKSAELTTERIIELAKITAPEDRQAWLRLAKAALLSEGVQQIAAPVEPRNNQGEASRVELGYQLFFDPILSNDKTTSCASCHHPDFGMADGLAKGVGAGGKGYGAHRAGTGPELARNTPSIFNVAFNNFQFWDGRVGSLEEQVLVPLFAENEMNQNNLADLLKRLRAIPRYRELFAKSFGFKSKQDGSEINLQNIARAIAAFERKLNITETNYDHFVKGKDDALTTEQLRGMVVFLGQGQCAVCHTPPNFHDGVLSSIGTTTSPDKNAPIDADPGFGAVIRREDGFGMFKTPGLRNVERTAPYMHHGAFKTLEEVVEFYNDGGGRGRGQDAFSQDSKVVKLNLTDQQKKDLVAFLKSLNDLSSPPVVPDSVPSGLPVVGK